MHLIMPLFSSSPSFLTWKNFILSACLHFLFTCSVVELKHTQKLLPNTPEITWKIKSEREEGRNCGLDLLKNIVLFVVGHINSHIITNQDEYSLLCPCLAHHYSFWLDKTLFLRVCLHFLYVCCNIGFEIPLGEVWRA